MASLSRCRWHPPSTSLSRCRVGLSCARRVSLLGRARRTPTSDSEVLYRITAAPFYELSAPPLPIRFSWLLLLLDAVFTGTGVALAWQHWTCDAPGDEDGAPAKRELRPANQRLALACFHVGIGSVVALRLLNVRRSHVRKLWLFPGSVPGKYRRATVLPSLDTVVVESYSLFDPRVQFTLERNAYRFVGHKQDAVLRITPPGRREEGFVLPTEGVKIDGKPVARGEALGEILDPFRQSPSSANEKARSKKKKRPSPG